MDNTAEHRARLTVVEHRLEEVTNVVKDLAHSFNKFVQSQSSAPRPIPFKEIIVTAAATLAVFAGVLQFLDTRSAQAFDVYKYRIEQLEKKVNPSVQFVKPVQ